MRFFILALFVITASLPVSALAQHSEGYLGQISSKYMVRGKTYEMNVYSYDFSPGIEFTSPTGQLSHTMQEALQRPFHDGRGMVKHMKSKFHADETGNYQMRVFSWDQKAANMTYSMHIGEGPAPVDPIPSPSPAPDPIDNRPCPSGQCWDPHAQPSARCVNINEPNYCDLNGSPW